MGLVVPKESENQFSRALLLAPVIFVCHFLEESPTFVEWFNSRVARDITSALFWQVNISGLVITVTVVAIERFLRCAASMTLAIGWFALLMFANAVFHIAGGIVEGRYVPGLATAAVLYVPFYLWLFVKAVKSERVSAWILFGSALLGSIPMLVHGYLILFRGDRLF
jgi:hypothetical protein